MNYCIKNFRNFSFLGAAFLLLSSCMESQFGSSKSLVGANEQPGGPVTDATPPNPRTPVDPGTPVVVAPDVTVDPSTLTFHTGNLDAVGNNGSSDSPRLSGSLGGDADSISFYSDSSCSQLIKTVSAGDFALGTELSMPTNRETQIYTKVNKDSLSSDCDYLTSYVHDSIPPEEVGGLDLPGAFNLGDKSPVISWNPVADAHHYQYALGTSEGASDITPVADIPPGVTSLQRTNLNLADDQRVYLSMRSVDAAGNYSDWVSTSWKVSLGAAPALTMNIPAENAMLSSTSSMVAGGCDEDGGEISISYQGDNISGPAEASCEEGYYRFIVQLTGLSGERNFEISQVNRFEAQQEVERKVQITHGFNVGAGFNSAGYVLALEHAGNGKVYVGGGFTQYKGNTQKYLARLNSDGSVDESFNVSNSLNGVVRSIITLKDGKVAVAGDFTKFNNATANRLVVLNADGTLDSGFVSGVGFNNRIRVLKKIPNSDDFLVGGTFTKYNNVDAYRFTRLQLNGSMSNIITPENAKKVANGYVHDIEVKDDGSIFLAGSFTKYGTENVGRLVYINEDGSRNNAFSIAEGGANNNVYSVKLDDQGRLYVGGIFTSYNGSTGWVRFIRLKPDGLIDGTLSPKVINDAIHDIEFDNEGKLVLTGSFTKIGSSTVNRITRLDTDGNIVNEFDIGVGLPSYWGYKILPTEDSSVHSFLLAGYYGHYRNQDFNHLVRVLHNGKPDVGTVDKGGPNSGRVFAVIADPKHPGRSYVGGSFSQWNGQNVGYIVRIHADGSLDESFNRDPNTGALNAGFNHYVYTLATDGDDVYAGGEFTRFNGQTVARFVKMNHEGVLNSEFISNLGTGYNAAVYDVKVHPNTKKLYVGGNYSVLKGQYRYYVSSLNPDGTDNTEFALSPQALNGYVRRIAFSKDLNHVFLGGAFSTLNGNAQRYFVRLNMQGVVDNTDFNLGSGFNHYIFDIETLEDGRIYVGGYFSAYDGAAHKYIVRLKANGDVDPTFATGAGFSSYVYNIHVAADKSVYVGGHFTKYQGSNAHYLAHLNEDGSLDRDFRGEGGFNSYVDFVTEDFDGSGRVWAGGAFTTYRGAYRQYIVRLNSDGTLN